jgi:hypothetical protein
VLDDLGWKPVTAIGDGAHWRLVAHQPNPESWYDSTRQQLRRVGRQAAGNLRDLYPSVSLPSLMQTSSCQRDVATLGENSIILAIELRVKSLTSRASAFAVVGKFRLI